MGFPGHFVASGVYLSEYTTAFQTQSPLHTSESLLCIRNAGHLVVTELLPKWPWAEPSRAPPTDNRLQVLPGRHREIATCYFQALGLVAGNQSPSRQRTPSQFQNRVVQTLGE